MGLYQKNALEFPDLLHQSLISSMTSVKNLKGEALNGVDLLHLRTLRVLFLLKANSFGTELSIFAFSFKEGH